MIRRRLLGAAIAGVAALSLIGAARPATQPRANWDTQVTGADRVHVVGNPRAAVKLTEYFSYTCPHCAEFARQSDGALKLGYIAPGRVSFELRHLIRDPIDLVVGMLVTCGPAAKFRANHDLFLLGQNRWIGPYAQHSPAQEARWRLDSAAGRRAIASDFKFYELMVPRGYTRVQLDRCLADQAKATRMQSQAVEEWNKPGIDGTPTFALNGNLIGTNTWVSLERQIKDVL